MNAESFGWVKINDIRYERDKYSCFEYLMFDSYSKDWVYSYYDENEQKDIGYDHYSSLDDAINETK